MVGATADGPPKRSRTPESEVEPGELGACVPASSVDVPSGPAIERRRRDVRRSLERIDPAQSGDVATTPRSAWTVRVLARRPVAIEEAVTMGAGWRPATRWVKSTATRKLTELA